MLFKATSGEVGAVRLRCRLTMVQHAEQLQRNVGHDCTFGDEGLH
jgi:hypothetical protein